MGTPYQTIFDGVISKLRSPGIPNIEEEVLMDTLADFIRPACVKFRACRQDLSQRNHAAMIFNIHLTDEEIEILVNFVLLEFIEMNFVRTPTLMTKSLTSRDYHVFSSANHLKALAELTERIERQTRQIISAYSHGGSEMLTRLKEEQERRRNAPVLGS